MKRTTCAALAALALSAALFAQELPARKRPRLTAKDEAMRLAAGLTAEAALVAGRLAACGAREAAAELKAAEERAAAEAAAGKLEAANTKRRAALSLAREELAARTAVGKSPAAVVAPARAAKPSALPASVPRELAAARTLLDTLEAGCARGTDAPVECGELLARARAGFEHARERLAAGDPEGPKLARETIRELATAVAQYAHASASEDEEPETGRL